MLKLRRTLSEDLRVLKSMHVSSWCMDVIQKYNPGVVALYASVGGEVDTGVLAAWCMVRGVRVVFPKTVGENLVFAEGPLRSHGMWVQGKKLDIPEPVGSVLLLDELDMIMVPGVAFDTQGNRLGFGAGYYDRTLSRVKAVRVGLAYGFQYVNHVPVMDHDVPMHWVCTEQAAHCMLR
jgi:5-formyltetrahydrofolate cyclo-ligase